MSPHHHRKRLWRRSATDAPYRRSECASVLIIVLWITFGLISLALYFGQSMFFEFRASDNSVAGVESEQAIEGAARYVGYMLTNLVEMGMIQQGQVPDLQLYEPEEVPLGDATFWLLGRADQSLQNQEPHFALIDEASKLNLNTATVEMLEALPGMTSELAAAIVDWRDSDSDPTENGAESEVYQRLTPPYNCKNAPFETVEELRLVYGADPVILCGEDYNRNGFLDPNENDGELSPPFDNRDGKLDFGILEFLTVYSRDPNTRTNGSPRIDVNADTGTDLSDLLLEKLGESRAAEIQAQVVGNAAGYQSLIEFYLRSQMTDAEFALVEADLTVTNATSIQGLINVNTASPEVLACIPGIGFEKAAQVVAARQSRQGDLNSMGWLKDSLDETSLIQAGPYLTSRSYQFTADIAAVGHYGRGYRRTQFVFDTSQGDSKIIYRRDLSRLGWALGILARERMNTLELTQRTPSYR
ncbi:MAG: type II secretion system protein GspK [Verrucomicrobia bacterium]|nr:type II secretion system protein GspK [Verrucomicrobiota bacterium]